MSTSPIAATWYYSQLISILTFCKESRVDYRTYMLNFSKNLQPLSFNMTFLENREAYEHNIKQPDLCKVVTEDGTEFHLFSIRKKGFEEFTIYAGIVDNSDPSMPLYSSMARIKLSLVYADWRGVNLLDKAIEQLLKVYYPAEMLEKYHGMLNVMNQPKFFV